MEENGDIRRVRHGEVDVLARLLAKAFEQQPVHQWVLPTEAERRRASHRLFGIAIRRASEDGLALTTEGLEGVALWLPPDGARTRFPRDLLFGLESLCVLRTRFLRSLRANWAMARAHPKERHWYLVAIGTDPRVQGRGIASRLLASVLSRCDWEGTPAYLETAGESNVAFYEARGFTVAGEFSISAEGPRVWSMCRQPRPQVGASDPGMGNAAPNDTGRASVDVDSEPAPFWQRALRSRGLWSIAAVIAGAILLARWLQSTGGIAEMRTHYGNSVAVIAIFMQAFLSLSPVPSQIVAIPTAIVFGFWLGALLLWTGWLLAAFVQSVLLATPPGSWISGES